MENNIILSPVPLDVLIQQIREVVKQEIKADQQQAEEKLLSVAEACQLFKPAISRQTLTNWTKDGLIPMSKYGGKNYYKLTDVLAAGTTLKRYKK
jgi:hypothetical protein